MFMLRAHTAPYLYTLVVLFSQKKRVCRSWLPHAYDSLVAKKEHQDKDKIAEKEKEVSSELNKLRDQQELIVDLMAKELSLR